MGILFGEKNIKGGQLGSYRVIYYIISEKEKLWPPILVNMKRSNELHALCALNLVSASQQSKNIYKKIQLKLQIMGVHTAIMTLG